jgi:integrase/recombinase XerD
MIVSDAFEHFLNHCRAERHVSPSSLAKYRDCFRAWIGPWFGQKEVSSVNRLHVLDMRQAMMNRQLSVARQYSVIMSLKSFLKFCRIGLGIAGIDPSEITLPKRKAPQVEFLSNDEIQRMLNAIDTGIFTGMRLRALVELLLSTGMRISEALSLKREMFDTDQNETEIVGKGKLKRHIFFTPRCRFWLKQYLAKRYDDSPWLFVTTGYPVRKWAQADISRFFILLKKRAVITKKLSPHILRHTFCTNLLHHGADITHIKDLAGHQDIQTTARYYLGKDKAVLRQIVDRCLDYGSGSVGLPHSLEPTFGPKANLHREGADQSAMPAASANPSQPPTAASL